MCLALNFSLIQGSLPHSQSAMEKSGSSPLRVKRCSMIVAGKAKSENSTVRIAKKALGEKKKDESQESADHISKKMQPLTTMIEDDDNDSEELDDETWIAKKKEFWKRDNISPLKIEGGGSMSPKELANLLSRTFGLE